MKKRIILALTAMWLSCLAAVAVSPQYTVTVSNMNELTNLSIATMNSLEQAVNPVSAPTALVLGYYSPGDRGGGTFMWDPNSSAIPDGGRYFATNGWTSGNGRWVRQLNGEVANVKMWGAVGNGTTDDTIAIQNAARALNYPWCGELLFPAATYLLTDTIIYPGQYHLRGEGPNNNTIILMHGDHDVFRTYNAQTALTNGVFDFDHGLIFENMNIIMDTNAMSGAGLELCNPGEGTIIRNVSTSGGGYGVRVLDGGSPGLQISQCSVSHCYVAGISVEGIPSGANAGGQIMNITSLSGDHHRPDSDATASLVRIDNTVMACSVYNFKAEGSWGGGLFYYNRGIGTTNANNWQVGSLTIYGGYYNCGFTNCDLVVLDSVDHWRTASVTIHPIMVFGIGHLIRDEVTPRNIDPGLYDTSTSFALDQIMCRLPINYEGVHGGQHGTSRCIIGGVDTAAFVPTTTNAWYRVMDDSSGFAFGGRLIVSDLNHSSEANVDIDPNGGSTGPLITVERATKSGAAVQPCVTKMRAGCYYDPAQLGSRYFVDIYVDHSFSAGDTEDDKIMVACPFEDQHREFTGLVAPISAYTDDPTPPGCTFVSCVTNSLTR